MDVPAVLLSMKCGVGSSCLPVIGSCERVDRMEIGRSDDKSEEGWVFEHEKLCMSASRCMRMESTEIATIMLFVELLQSAFDAHILLLCYSCLRFHHVVQLEGCSRVWVHVDVSSDVDL